LGDTAIAAQCLINGGTGSGQDTLALTSIPYPITAGSASIYNVAGSLVSSSNSIVSLPIFDQTQSPTLPANGAVTIVGFVQVFINSIDAATGNLNVTVLNVAGCGNQATGNAVVGTSPVPVRLITPP
jgi:hypothetical protein